MTTTIALIWEQFAPYHIDRIEAVGQRLAGRAAVLGVEVATASEVYAWAPSGKIDHARKLTLFPGESYERISPWRRFWRMWRAVSSARVVFVGIGYHRPDIIALSWLLRLTGRRAVMITDSKFDDRSRLAVREWGKAALLRAYRGAIVAGRRQRDFVHLLGFADDDILPGYDTVGIARIRAEAAQEPVTAYADRAFICVARLVPKKNLFSVLTAYARYVQLEQGPARRLVIAGSGPLAEPLARHVEALGLAGLVEFTGFVTPAEVSRLLAASLALLLLSTEEQWGLVVNEAVALAIPVIASHAVGSTDALVRNLISGYLFEPDAVEGPARAMLRLASDEGHWQSLAEATRDMAWLADSDRFSDAVEMVTFPAEAVQARANVARYRAVLAETG